MSRMTRPQQIARTLKTKGHVTEVTGQAEWGRMHVGRAIFALRHDQRHLLPSNTEIVSVEKRDSNGNRFVEWQLQKRKAA